jgi:hypothetical protein
VLQRRWEVRFLSWPNSSCAIIALSAITGLVSVAGECCGVR